MKFWKRIVVWKLCFKLIALPILLAYQSMSYGQALPVANPALVNRATSGVIQQALITRGFAANDPRFGNTVARATPYLATAVAGAAAITAGVVTAPAWVTVALGVGIGTVVGYVVNLGLDSLVRWLFRTDKLIDQSSESALANVNCVMNIGGDFFTAGFLDPSGVYTQYFGCDGVAVASQANFAKTGLQLQTPCIVSTSGSATCNGITGFKYSGSTRACPAGSFSNGTQCLGFTYTTSPVPTATAIGVQTAVNQIPASDLDRPLNPAVIAGLANRVWQQTAAQPGYDGVPYPVSNPITPADVRTWANANPAIVPTVRDFTAPNPVSVANPTPWAIPANPAVSSSSPITATMVAPIANSGTINPAASNPLQNLGVDPVTAAPTLESTPTAQMILAPILNMLPTLRSFNVTGHTATCPKPTVSLVGRTITMDAHCTVIDSIKPILQTAMLFAWAAIALFIILAA